jgi:spore maturation protein SpmB
MDHPAAGAMVMNFAANALNLDNAATPAGLRAMQELQKLNPSPDTASNHQVLFMVMHAASLTLIPVSILAVRAAGGASNPADVFLPLLLASACSALGGFLAVALVQRLKLWDPVLLGFLLLVAGIIGGIAWGMSRLPAEQVQTLSSQISGIALFAAIFWFLAQAIYTRINAWEAFIEGAKEGFTTAIQIAPYLIGILVAVGVFRASGGLDYVVAGIWHLLAWTGLPQEASGAIPTMLMKPLAGGASRGLMIDAMKAYGPDSFTARLAGIFQGSTDTTLYVIALYSGAANLKRLRHTLPCALVADLAGWIGAIVMAMAFFL